MFHYKSNLKRPKGVFNKLKVQVNYKLKKKNEYNQVDSLFNCY